MKAKYSSNPMYEKPIIRTIDIGMGYGTRARGLAANIHRNLAKQMIDANHHAYSQFGLITDLDQTTKKARRCGER